MTPRQRGWAGVAVFWVWVGAVLLALWAGNPVVLAWVFWAPVAAGIVFVLSVAIFALCGGWESH